VSQIRRRQFLIVAGALLAAPLSSEAQRPAKIRRIGMLIPVRAADAAGNIDAFRQGLRDLGYTEGQHVIIEPNPNTGGDIPTETAQVAATQTIHHGATTRSRIVLPLIPR
jgi:hypothetical protein